MLLVFLLPLLFLALLMVASFWPLDAESLKMIAMILLATGGVVLFLYLVVIFIGLRGREDIRYSLDDDGICKAVSGLLKHMNVIKWLLMLSGRPTYVGIGLMTRDTKPERMQWSQIKKIHPDPKNNTIFLNENLDTSMPIYCTEENYRQVLEWIQTHINHQH